MGNYVARLVGAVLCVCPLVRASAGQLDQELEAVLSGTPAGQCVSTIFYLPEQVDTPALLARLDAQRASLAARHEVAVRELQGLAAGTQDALLNRLAELQRAGDVQRFDAFWIVNAVRVDARPEIIRSLAQRGDVGTVYLNYPIENIAPADVGRPDPPDMPQQRSPETA